MNNLISKLVDKLKENGDVTNANTLQSISTEFVTVLEAFELGRALQSLYDREAECSNIGIDEDEIGEVILFVQDNIRQSKF